VSYIVDILLLLSCASIIFGLFMINQVCGFIGGGIIGIMLACLYAYLELKNNEKKPTR